MSTTPLPASCQTTEIVVNNLRRKSSMEKKEQLYEGTAKKVFATENP